MLSASANKLSRLKEQAEEYAALIMEELDPERLGYIEVGTLSEHKFVRFSDNSTVICTVHAPILIFISLIIKSPLLGHKTSYCLFNRLRRKNGTQTNNKFFR